MVHDIHTGDAPLPQRLMRAQDPEPDHPTGADDALLLDLPTLSDGDPGWPGLPARPDAFVIAPPTRTARTATRPARRTLAAVALAAALCGFGLAVALI